MLSFFLRFSPFHAPVHRSAVRALNNLINTALRPTYPLNITKMTNPQAIAIIEAAIAAINTTRAALAAQTAEFTSLREEYAGNAAVVASLNTQIESLTAADTEIDSALAQLAASLPQPEPQPEPVVPETGTEMPAEPEAPVAE